MDFLSNLSKKEQASITENEIIDMTESLNTINFQIAELARIKEKLEHRLTDKIGHPDDKSKSYKYGKFKITCTTGFTYLLDKAEYEVMKDALPEQFNPVRVKKSYEVDKRKYIECLKYANDDELKLLDSIICPKPKKLHVKISSGV